MLLSRKSLLHLIKISKASHLEKMAPVSIMCLNPSLFSSPPSNPRVNDPSSSNAPPPLPVPIREHNPKKFKQPLHSRTHYHKPLPSKPAVIAADGDRSVVVGESGISYLLPNAPFEYQFSYSETPKAKPLAIREPAFLPFGPQTMNRPWTGKAKLVSKKEKERKKKIRLFDPDSFINDDKEEDEEEDVMVKRVVVDKRGGEMGKWSVGGDGRSREEVLGERLKRWEIRQLVKPLLSTNRQLNLGRDGLTHNMLEMIHSHWRRQQVCKVRCRGVPTVDMDNVCYHLEEKSGGKIIHRIGGIVYLFRGRNYNPRTRPRYPLMLWKPAAPVYPKLIQNIPEGLTESEAEELRSKGKKLLPICKLAKNGIYLNLVKDVRDAFEESLLVKVNCEGLHASDYKKIGAKLMELVPCVLLSFDDEQILMWRGKDWKPRYQAPPKLNLKGENESITKQDKTPSRMFLLWKRAIDMHKALLLDDGIELSPDSLLEKVEQFQSLTQADEHTYPASIVTNNRGNVMDDEFDDTIDGISNNFDKFGIDVGDMEDDDSSVPYGSLPVDRLAERLRVDRRHF